MPNSATPTLAILRDQIKIEARVKGADNLDAFIDATINELLLDYAQKNRYFEFLVTNSPVTTVLATSGYTLPTDFMNIRLVRYRQTSTGYTRTLEPRSSFVNTPNGRLPRYYDLAGNQIQVFPFDDLPEGDILLIDYHKIPDTLTGASVFPVPRLLPSVKLDTIHRVLLFNRELAEAAAMKGEAFDNETRSHPVK